MHEIDSRRCLICSGPAPLVRTCWQNELHSRMALRNGAFAASSAPSSRCGLKSVTSPLPQQPPVVPEVRGMHGTGVGAPRAVGGQVRRCQDDVLDPAAPPTIAGEPAMKNATPTGARNSLSKRASECTAAASCPSAASTTRKMGPLAKRARTSPARAPSRRWPCAVKLSRQSPVPLSQCVASCAATARAREGRSSGLPQVQTERLRTSTSTGSKLRHMVLPRYAPAHTPT